MKYYVAQLANYLPVVQFDNLVLYDTAEQAASQEATIDNNTCVFAVDDVAAAQFGNIPEAWQMLSAFVGRADDYAAKPDPSPYTPIPEPEPLVIPTPPKLLYWVHDERDKAELGKCHITPGTFIYTCTLEEAMGYARENLKRNGGSASTYAIYSVSENNLEPPTIVYPEGAIFLCTVTPECFTYLGTLQSLQSK